VHPPENGDERTVTMIIPEAKRNLANWTRRWHSGRATTHRTSFPGRWIRQRNRCPLVQLAHELGFAA
jgi:hypothetical protein